MIDDSLSDVQQEKKMSVKELKFEGNSYDMNICIEDCKIVISMQEEEFKLDRNQAHLLMLYLQEHLNFVAQVLKLKGYWKCNCGLYHDEGYICTRLAE